MKFFKLDLGSILAFFFLPMEELISSQASSGNPNPDQTSEGSS